MPLVGTFHGQYWAGASAPAGGTAVDVRQYPEWQAVHAAWTFLLAIWLGH